MVEGSSTKSRDDLLLSQLLALLPPAAARPETAPSSPPSPAPPHPRLSVVLNPHAGARQAETSWRTAAAFLRAQGLVVDEEAMSRTERAGDGERIGRELRERWIGEGERAQGREVLVVLGGDGTVHEVLNGLLLGGGGGSEEDGEGGEALWEGAGRVEVVLVPTGTANALYHHLFPPSPSYPPDSPAAPFYSLLSFLRTLSPPSSPSSSPQYPSSTLLPLPLALNELPSPCPRRTLTTVVSSAALHAALLHDAEELRAAHPGVERFKIAARQNVDRWWEGEVRLSGRVRRYDPATRAWVPATREARVAVAEDHDEGDGEAPTVVTGPFAYLVAALVSRFEPTFVVAPFRSPAHDLAPHPEREGGRPSIDVVAIRPLRHAPTAALERDGGEDERRRARDGFVERVWGVTGGMYDGGRHVDEVYGAGEAAEDGDEGRAVCEVWRSERVEWVPLAKDDDRKSRLVCLDGALHDVGTSGGSLKVRAVGGAASSVRVWA
ncbi:hypothetical protein JCM9279_001389 [Rhodotorula babjevae]